VLEDKIPQKEEKLLPRLVLNLVDGKRLVGYSGGDFVPVFVRNAKIDLAFDRISSMQFHSGSKAATVLLKNGEKLVCEPRLSELKLSTIVGEVSVSYDKIRELKVTPRGEFRP
jgi:hypothetical protein